ncbi:hypothetical protein [Streptosporangium sp. NPDC002721]|uniref:hypothetical protein n=1 Tax=Streptosporangium sp. NPDC002721 TaxID=3366188 RepID=UPI00369287D9
MEERPWDADRSRFASEAATPHRRLAEHLVAAMDIYLAEEIRKHRAGEGNSLRETGFTEVADLLGM